MNRLIAAEPKSRRQLLLRFSDGAWGMFDARRYIDADTEMTRPLSDLAFFSPCFIAAGALAWPNGFDLSAQSLHERLREAGALRRDVAAA